MAAAAAAAQQEPIRSDRVLRSGVDVVAVTATVLDAEGASRSGLPREAFEIYEDGEPQTITQFTNERVPVGLGVLLDMSDSMFGQRMIDARPAVERFLFELLDPRTSSSCSRSTTPHILTPLDEHADDVRAALAALKPSGGTAIYDAVLARAADDRQAARASARRCSSSRRRRHRERHVGRRRPLGAPPQRRVRLRGGDRLAETAGDQHAGQRRRRSARSPSQSGGRTEVVQDMDGLNAATARIAEELNSQYVMGYASPRATDGKFHSIRVRVLRPGFKVRARNGYVGVAKPQSH